MMLSILAESALRAFVLGGAVWLGLYLLRVRIPSAHMTAWIMVLLASLSMPLLSHWTTVTLTVQAPPLPPMEAMPSVDVARPEALPALPSPESTVSAATSHPAHQGIAINWWMVATVTYMLGAAFMLLRLLLGLHLTWRIVRASRPLHEKWTGDWDVRASSDVTGPVTVGSTILVPPDYTAWDATKRQAVLAHEGAHVANGDFYLLLLASLNRVLFWFSPFAWWQLVRLAELAEIISDDRAIEVLSDRVSYAEVLLELVRGAQGKVQAKAQGHSIAMEMARGYTVPTRIEIILAAATLPPRLGWRKRLSIVATILPFVVVSAGSIAYRTVPAAAHAVDAASDEAVAARRPQHTAFYSMGSNAVFAISGEGAEQFGQVTGARRLRLAALKDGAVSYSAAAGEITFAGDYDRQAAELVLRQHGHDVRAVRIAELSGEAGVSDKTSSDQYVGWYRLTPNRVLAVTREGDHVLAQDTGQTPVELVASGADAFVGKNGEVVIFLRDDKAEINRILFQEPVYGPRIAPRVDAEQARAAEARMARRVAEVSSRFTEQTPAPGSREAVLRGIEEIRHGTPNYDRMREGLAAAIRRQLPDLQVMLASFGAVDQIFFRGVGGGGYDIYGVKFANGSAEFRLSLAPDGKVNDLFLHADGDDEPGGAVECGKEASLKPPSDNIPIHITLFNNTGSDIHIYNLDRNGGRIEHGTIADSRWSVVLTSVNSPWVITDRSGQCLQVVLPGQDTRYFPIEAAGTDTPIRSNKASRNAPQAGSEDGLREYIIGLAQGQPNYDHMTPELADWTRLQLPYDQALVRKLGDLRALSFRGLTRTGMNIYMASFANGTAEWRIGLARNGAVARIALGPQY
jgi:beta-lactamase regulating signal transducer with metallopeptidase domain